MIKTVVHVIILIRTNDHNIYKKKRITGKVQKKVLNLTITGKKEKEVACHQNPKVS